MSLSTLVQCASCFQPLEDPTTLSCGYTVCRSCLPDQIPTKTIFSCPVSHCSHKTHLFGPEILLDALSQALCDCLAVDPDLSSQASSDLIQCVACQHTLTDPVTTHCGHTFCRRCILQSKLSTNVCGSCQRPLPPIDALQRQASNRLVVGFIRHTLHEQSLLASGDTPSENRVRPIVPLFYTSIGATILPTQQVRIVIPKSQLETLFGCLIPLQTQLPRLCLATVHRQPAKRNIGVYAEILDAEHCSVSDTVSIKLLGRDRFQILEIDDAEPMVASVLLLPDTMTKEGEEMDVAAAAHNQKKCVALAAEIYDFIVGLAEPNAHPPKLATDTHGLLGPTWLANAEKAQGKLPPPTDPVALGWWAAVILPLDASQRYELVRTRSLDDRLDFVRNWIQQLEQQWARCRATAIDTIVKTFRSAT